MLKGFELVVTSVSVAQTNYNVTYKVKHLVRETSTLPWLVCLAGDS